MRFHFFAKLTYLALILIFIPAAACASPSAISIGDFLTPAGQPSAEFKLFVQEKLAAAGLHCLNCTEPAAKSRYTISGLVENKQGSTSFSAMLTDNLHLEPEVFIKGKQVGGTTLEPAAESLAESAADLISNQTVASIEVDGNSRLTPNAVMALTQIRPGEKAVPQKIIAARIILENCGLFEKARIYLIPGPEGRKVRISIQERNSIAPGSIPGPGKEVLDNILGPPDISLPEFPKLAGKELSGMVNGTSPGYLAYKAENVLSKLRNDKPNAEDLEELTVVAAAIRNAISSSDRFCRDMCIILLKLCSMLDLKTIRTITEEQQQAASLDDSDPHNLEKRLERIEYFTQAYHAAQEIQLVLSSRIFHDRIHSPVVPWILYSLGEQALKAEDITRAAPLLSGAISVSSLPVAPEMLLTTAKAQYSNLDIKAGDAGSAQLKPLLADPDLDQELRSNIKTLPKLAALCETAIAITDDDSFELQLKKGDALILLDRPDLAEPLFHKLHSLKPHDARPFTGFARLAFQRTDKLLSVRPYIERADRMKNKDRFFYELALAYKLERITAEALPTIKIEGRNSVEASATRFLLPKGAEYAAGYERFNPAQAELIQAGIKVLDQWLAYPAMSTGDALGSMFSQTQSLFTKMGAQPVIIAANLYFSINASDRDEAARVISAPLPVKAGLKPRFLQLNLLIREMAKDPGTEIAQTLEQAGRSGFADAHSRNEAVALKADALAVSGMYNNSTQTLERAKELYSLAIDLNGDDKGRLLNNLGCVVLALGRNSEADDLYDEALDSSPQVVEAVELGKLAASLAGEEKIAALDEFLKKELPAEIRKAALLLKGNPAPAEQDLQSDEFTMPVEKKTRDLQIFLKEENRIVTGYDNYKGLKIDFIYDSNAWLLPPADNIPGTPLP